MDLINKEVFPMNTTIHFYCFVGDNCYGNYQIKFAQFFHVPRKNEVVMLSKELSFENSVSNMVKDIVSGIMFWRVEEVVNVIERYESNQTDIFVYLEPEDDFNGALSKVKDNAKNELSD